MTNQDLLTAVDRFDSPLYVYDAQMIASQYKRLTSAFKQVDSLKLHYAVKALSNLSVLKYISNLGAGLDTVSVQEVMLGLEAGADLMLLHPDGSEEILVD